MADYNALDTLSGVVARTFEATNTPVVLPSIDALPPAKYCLNKGINTGTGASVVYWRSPEKPDPTGAYYPYEATIPWSQITNVICVGIILSDYSW